MFERKKKSRHMPIHSILLVGYVQWNNHSQKNKATEEISSLVSVMNMNTFISDN